MKFHIFAVFATVLLSQSSTVFGLDCPPAESIAPAYCSYDDFLGLTVFYNSTTPTELNQADFNRMLGSLRQVNNLGQNDTLSIYYLFIYNFNLTSIDLTSFDRTSIDLLSIHTAHTLSQFSGNVSTSPLEVSTLQVSFCPSFGDETLEQLLQLLSPAKLKSIRIENADLTEFTSSKVDSSAIRNFTELQSLVLNSNRLTKVSGGKFANNRKLTTLSLVRNNLTEVGDNGLWFEEETNKDGESVKSDLLVINLEANQLTDEGISVNWGLSNLKNRPVRLNLFGNNVTTLAASKFETFLYASAQSQLLSNANPLICDKRMKWLKDGRETLERKVPYAYCSNDFGETVFTTDLI